MKVVSKKKFPKMEDAKSYLENKYGKKMVEAKENKARWLFMPGDGAATIKKAAKSYQDVLAEYRAQNPNVPYHEAQKAASEIFRALKAA